VKYSKKTAAFKNMEKNGYDEDNTIIQIPFFYFNFFGR
jgi:hypothetical protein